MRHINCFLALVVCAFATAMPAVAQTPAVAGAPYVPTPSAIADRMLALAKVGPSDYLIDLGSGDGRLVIAAVAKYKARGGMGVEIDRSLVKLATDEAEKAGVADRVTFVAGDLFVADVEQATVVTLYLLPSMLGDVEAKLRKELRPERALLHMIIRSRRGSRWKLSCSTHRRRLPSQARRGRCYCCTASPTRGEARFVCFWAGSD